MTPNMLDGPGFELPVYSPVCTFCAHLDREATDRPGRCAAFPAGIPVPIWVGDNDHRQPWQGDRGIQYAPASDTAGAA
jgi:hypothetical protein